MLNITVGTNTTRKTVMVTEDTTLRQCLEENGVNYSAGQTSLDGCVLQPGDMDKSFADMNVTDKAYLVVVQKLDNAVVM
jgi:hypothetical protein